MLVALSITDDTQHMCFCVLWLQARASTLTTRTSSPSSSSSAASRRSACVTSSHTWAMTCPSPALRQVGRGKARVQRFESGRLEGRWFPGKTRESQLALGPQLDLIQHGPYVNPCLACSGAAEAPDAVRGPEPAGGEQGEAYAKGGFGMVGSGMMQGQEGCCALLVGGPWLDMSFP